MLERTVIVVPVFLAVQTIAVHWIAGSERPPAPPALSQFPQELSGWKQLREDPIASDVADQLHADQLLSRIYVNQQGTPAALLTAWFQSQRGGASQPHSPKVCLPASGWTPESAGELQVDTAAGSILVNRYIVANGSQRAVVLYWYQTARRVIASEWSAKFWSVADAVRDKRTDIALVRVVAWSGPGGDAGATLAASSFARSVYPVMRSYLPR